MIEAVKPCRIPGTFAADLRAAMGAAVQIHPDIAGFIAAENHRTATHGAGFEIAGFGNFRGMPAIYPAFVEDLAMFLIQNGGIGQRPAVEPEGQIFGVIDNEWIAVHRLHCSFQ